MTERQNEYAEYLKSDHWESVKTRKKDIEPMRCLSCLSVVNVQLHHMVYRVPVEAVQDDDTCWLCHACHAAFHASAGMILMGIPYHLLRAETVRVILTYVMRKMESSKLKVTAEKTKKQIGKEQRRKSKQRKKSFESAGEIKGIIRR